MFEGFEPSVRASFSPMSITFFSPMPARFSHTDAKRDFKRSAHRALLYRVSQRVVKRTRYDAAVALHSAA